MIFTHALFSESVWVHKINTCRMYAARRRNTSSTVTYPFKVSSTDDTSAIPTNTKWKRRRTTKWKQIHSHKTHRNEWSFNSWPSIWNGGGARMLTHVRTHIENTWMREMEHRVIAVLTAIEYKYQYATFLRIIHLVNDFNDAPTK